MSTRRHPGVGWPDWLADLVIAKQLRQLVCQRNELRWLKDKIRCEFPHGGRTTTLDLCFCLADGNRQPEARAIVASDAEPCPVYRPIPGKAKPPIIPVSRRLIDDASQELHQTVFAGMELQLPLPMEPDAMDLDGTALQPAFVP